MHMYLNISTYIYKQIHMYILAMCACECISTQNIKWFTLSKAREERMASKPMFILSESKIILRL